MQYTLLFLNPGHFHAALTLREIHPLVNEEFHVYAEDGPDLRTFLELVASFNDRDERPTCWRPIVNTGLCPLAQPLRVPPLYRRGVGQGTEPRVSWWCRAGGPEKSHDPWYRYGGKSNQLQL